jgi:Arc/MetJ-type ribon-helix-helix transcriptional regulator
MTADEGGEVLRDALQELPQKQNMRHRGVDELREVWHQAMKDNSPGVHLKEVLNRLEQKYRALAKLVR